MRNQILLCILVSISIYSCKKDIAVFNPTNPFENIQIVEKQIFDLDTISIKEIIGEKGTKIYFNREDFDINENDKVTLELKEYYNRLELISNNLNTLTDNGELLESNGVIYINFQVNNEKIHLKENKKLKINFPNKFKVNDKIFNGKLDSLNQIKWVENRNTFTSFYIVDKEITRRFGIMTYFEKIIPIDSLEIYKNLSIQPQSDLIEEIGDPDWWISPTILTENFEWINVDRIVNEDSKISFELAFNKTNLDKISVFFLYSDLNSFISEYRKYSDLKFSEIPLKNETSMIIVGQSGNDFFVNRSILNKDIKGKLEINLIQIDSYQLKSILLK